MKNIPGFDNYSITKGGRVWSRYTNKWLKSCPQSNGYLLIQLFKNKKAYNKNIHRLVLETYVGKCPDDLECMHLDGNKLNNNLSNLEWGTHSKNAKDMVKHNKLIGEKRCNHKLTASDARMIVYMYRTGIFLMQEIADTYKVTKTLVWQIIHKKAWKHIWAEKESLKI